jgi:hypothetical protein
MTHHSPGRPSKSDDQKRQPLHISVYTEDLQRLEQLTNNRSEFLRSCVQRAWEEEHGEQVTLSVTLPKWLIEEILKTVTAQIPEREGAMIQSAVKSLLRR